MKHLRILLLFFCSMPSFYAQISFETIESSKLGQTRELKIQLPRSYNPDDAKKYPLFIVLDGDYMFEAVAGNVNYYAYWDDMPEAIVVGINQNNTRFDDCMYSEENGLPTNKGANFFEFIGMELIPYIEKKYKSSNFRVAFGHGETANFINYFLLKPDTLFKGYVSVSPELAPKMIDYLSEVLVKIKSKTFYYLARTNNDSASIKQMADTLNTRIAAIDNINLFYEFNNFEKPSHYLVPTHAIPNAIAFIFKAFQPISKEEYTNTILKLEDSPVTYLEEKYKTISELYGINKPISINDFIAISSAIEKTEKFKDFKDLAKIAQDTYPKTLLSNYYLGRFYENNNQPKKAMLSYQAAFTLEEIGDLTNEMMLQKAEAIKADFGY